jgi:hypothetical protein
MAVEKHGKMDCMNEIATRKTKRRTVTAETRAKLSEAHRRRYARYRENLAAATAAAVRCAKEKQK